MTSIKPFFFSALILHLVLGSPVSLEKDVQAQRYKVKLSLLEDKMSFTGDEVVSVKAIKETSVLRLKYSNAGISTVSVYDPRKPKVELVRSSDREEDNSLLVNLLSPLQKDAVYIVKTVFSGTFGTDMTFERLFEQKENGNVFPCFENSDFQAIYEMSIILSQDGEQNEMQSLDVNQAFEDIEEERASGSPSNTDDPIPTDDTTPNPNPISTDDTTPDPNPTTTTPAPTEEPDSDNAASFTMISSTLLSIVAICVISLR